MSIVMLERAADELAPFLDEVAFVGGATVGLWITDPAAPEPRPTKDVDIVVEIASLLAWHNFEERLRAQGLRNDSSSRVICRWIAGTGDNNLLIDVMPTNASILGFENRWQRPALDLAQTVELPSGQGIRAITPPYLVATKLEAWNGRGRGDHLRSHDLEDVIKLVDGREEIVAEVAAAPGDLRSYLSNEIAALLDQPRFVDAIEGTIVGLGGGGSGAGSGDEDRVNEVVLPRFRDLAVAGRAPGLSRPLLGSEPDAVVRRRNDRLVGTTIKLGPSTGGLDGYRNDFLLDRDLKSPITVDASELGPTHPMFLIRLRLFVDWHLAAGHAVSVTTPDDPVVAQHLADMRVHGGLPSGIFGPLPSARSETAAVLGLRRLSSYHDVEDAAAVATDVLGRRVPALGTWGDATHMAISELCDNAILHGDSELGAYVAADRLDHPQPTFRLAIADLGIGIPEHIRAQHPEWQDDSGAIGRVLDRGVTGTGDRMRGNGYAEVLDQAHGAQLRRSMSALTLDIRSARGHVRVRLVDEAVIVEPVRVKRPRRGTWISYDVVSVE